MLEIKSNKIEDIFKEVEDQTVREVLSFANLSLDAINDYLKIYNKDNLFTMSEEVYIFEHIVSPDNLKILMSLNKGEESIPEIGYIISIDNINDELIVKRRRVGSEYQDEIYRV